MSNEFKVVINDWANGKTIPAKFAFAKPSQVGRIALSDNLSPAIAWQDAPAGTKSFAIICHDPDVPSSATDVNQEGKTVPASLPRVDFFHWVLIDIPADIREIGEGVASKGITPRGKPFGKTPIGVSGINNYTDWFASDLDMSGNYGQYDGPCPPWNDTILHHYHFTVYALDVPTLGLTGKFGGKDVMDAAKGHVLAKASHMGTYSLNPSVFGA